jgi:hypothetical protein
MGRFTNVGQQSKTMFNGVVVVVVGLVLQSTPCLIIDNCREKLSKNLADQRRWTSLDDNRQQAKKAWQAERSKHSLSLAMAH